jgi:hypothetical protein
MVLRVKSPRDLGAGIVFAAIGLVGLWFGRAYTFGSAARMGPGYFPMVLSGLLMLFGAGIALRSLVLDGPPIERASLRSTGLIVACILLFGLMIGTAGLGPTVVAVTILAAIGMKDAQPLETLALGVGLAVFSVLVFVYGLRQPLPVFFDAWLR